MAAGAWLGCAAVAGAQTAAGQPAAPADNQPHVISAQDLDMLRKDIRSQKKQLMAQNLKLTDEDATKFWPIYDQYTAELVKINKKKYATIQKYADVGTLTDDQAMALIKQWLDVDTAVSQPRLKYLPIVGKAIGGKKAATWAQLDRRIQSMIDLQLGSRLPLAQGH
jgi:Spy/CpxP family protein refolding chaperone